MGRYHRIHVVLHDRKYDHQYLVLEETSTLHNITISIVIDLGAMKCLISPNSLLRCSLVAT